MNQTKVNQLDSIIEALIAISKDKEKQLDDYDIVDLSYIKGGYTGLFNWFKSKETTIVHVPHNATPLLNKFLANYQNKESVIFRYLLRWPIDGNRKKTNNFFDSILSESFCNGFEQGKLCLRNQEQNIYTSDDLSKYVDLYINKTISKLKSKSSMYSYWQNSLNIGKISGISWQAKVIKQEKLSKDKAFHSICNTEEQAEPTILTIYDKDINKLKNAHQNFVKAGLIESDLSSWLYWFGGVSNSMHKKIKWLYKGKTKTKSNKRALSYFIEKISANGQIDFSNARKIFDKQIYVHDKYQCDFDDIKEVLKNK